MYYKAIKFSIPFYSNRYNLLDMKISNVLASCHDQVILSAVRTIIQNMVSCEDPSQQQLHYLQSCGFGGLWRFAGPFNKVRFSSFFFLCVYYIHVYCLHIFFLQYNNSSESSELFVNYLEAMVETCLPTEESEADNGEVQHYPSMLGVSSHFNLSSSLSSLANSPADRDCVAEAGTSFRRASFGKLSPKQIKMIHPHPDSDTT